MSQQKEKILNMLHGGVISKEQASELLEALGESSKCHDALFEEKMKPFESKFEAENDRLASLKCELGELKKRLASLKSLPKEEADFDVDEEMEDLSDEIEAIEDEIECIEDEIEEEIEDLEDDGAAEDFDDEILHLRAVKSQIKGIMDYAAQIVKKSGALAEKGIETAAKNLNVFGGDAVISKKSAAYTGEYDSATVFIKCILGDFKFSGDFKVKTLLENNDALSFLDENVVKTVYGLLDEKFAGEYKSVSSREILKVRIGC